MNIDFLFPYYKLKTFWEMWYGKDGQEKSCDGTAVKYLHLRGVIKFELRGKRDEL